MKRQRGVAIRLREDGKTQTISEAEGKRKKG